MVVWRRQRRKRAATDSSTQDRSAAAKAAQVFARACPISVPCFRLLRAALVALSPGPGLGSRRASGFFRGLAVPACSPRPILDAPAASAPRIVGHLAPSTTKHSRRIMEQYLCQRVPGSFSCLITKYAVIAYVAVGAGSTVRPAGKVGIRFPFTRRLAGQYCPLPSADRPQIR